MNGDRNDHFHAKHRHPFRIACSAHSKSEKDDWRHGSYPLPLAKETSFRSPGASSILLSVKD